MSLRRTRPTRVAHWIALGAAHLLACAPAQPRSTVVLPGARATMSALGFNAVGAIVERTVARGATESHTVTLQAGHCYRVMAIATSAGADLELALFTGDGDRAGESLTSGQAASVGYCASNSGTFRAAVSGRNAAGLYLFSLWERDERLSGENSSRGTCANPVPLELGGSVVGSLVTALDNAAGGCVAGHNPDVVHVLELERRQRVQLTVLGNGPRAVYIRRTCAGGGSGAGLAEGATVECAVPRAEGPARIDTTLEPGRYYVLVESVGDGTRGNYTLTSNEAESPEAADICARAISIAPGTVVHGSTEGATDAIHGTCASSRFPGGDVTYALTVAQRSRIRASVDGETRWDTGVYVRSNCVDSATEVMCNDDTDDRSHSVVAKTLDPGRYSVTVDGFALGEHGPYTLSIEQSPPEGSGVDNDTCASAHLLTLGQSISGDTFAAHNDVQLGCGGAGPDVAYRMVLPRRMLVRAELLARGVGADDDRLSLGFLSTCAQGSSESHCSRTHILDAILPAGTHFLIVDGITRDDYGRFSVKLDGQDAAPIEANCREARLLPLNVRTNGSTRGRADRLHAQCGHGAASGDIVHTVEVPRRGQLHVLLRTADFDGVVSVRSACEREATELGCAMQDGNRQARVDLPVEPGRYSIIVDGFDRGNTGDYQIEARFE